MRYINLRLTYILPSKTVRRRDSLVVFAVMLFWKSAWYYNVTVYLLLSYSDYSVWSSVDVRIQRTGCCWSGEDWQMTGRSRASDSAFTYDSKTARLHFFIQTSCLCCMPWLSSVRCTYTLCVECGLHFCKQFILIQQVCLCSSLYAVNIKFIPNHYVFAQRGIYFYVWHHLE